MSKKNKHKQNRDKMIMFKPFAKKTNAPDLTTC